MAFRYSDDTVFTPIETRPTTRRERFSDRFPDYATWFDGNVWAIGVNEILDAGMGIPGFRATLHYQAKALGVTIVTKIVKNTTEEGIFRPLFLVKATNQD